MSFVGHQITQHIRYELTPLPFGTLLLLVATSDMQGMLGETASLKIGKG